MMSFDAGTWFAASVEFLAARFWSRYGRALAVATALTLAFALPAFVAPAAIKRVPFGAAIQIIGILAPFVFALFAFTMWGIWRTHKRQAACVQRLIAQPSRIKSCFLRRVTVAGAGAGTYWHLVFEGLDGAEASVQMSSSALQFAGDIEQYLRTLAPQARIALAREPSSASC
jgi:hypothetical protein